MKFRIIGTLLVLAVLAALGFATGVFDNKPTVPQTQPTSSSDADLKGLKIN